MWSVAVDEDEIVFTPPPTQFSRDVSFDLASMHLRWGEAEPSKPSYLPLAPHDHEERSLQEQVNMAWDYYCGPSSQETFVALHLLLLLATRDWACLEISLCWIGLEPSLDYRTQKGMFHPRHLPLTVLKPLLARCYGVQKNGRLAPCSRLSLRPQAFSAHQWMEIHTRVCHILAPQGFEMEPFLQAFRRSHVES